MSLCIFVCPKQSVEAKIVFSSCSCGGKFQHKAFRFPNNHQGKNQLYSYRSPTFLLCPDGLLVTLHDPRGVVCDLCIFVYHCGLVVFRAAYNRLRLRPRVLRSVSAVDTRCTVLGARMTSPIGISPTGDAFIVQHERGSDTCVLIQWCPGCHRVC